MKSINPATGKSLCEVDEISDSRIEEILSSSGEVRPRWSRMQISERAELLAKIAATLESGVDECATLISLEMGKPLAQSRAEVEKCALVCRHYAEHGAEMLEPRPYESDATRSFVEFQPLGTVLATMPWNFPFWQLFRCAAPALLAGNTVILKHASNVPQCSSKIAELFSASGFPGGVFQTVLIGGNRVGKLIDDKRIDAVSLTGSSAAGKKVASRASGNIKKSVLELGGSDAFIVLPDADLDQAVKTGVKARYQNSGQSCIAAKRFILVDEIADDFIESFVEQARDLVVGDPLGEDVNIGPMAREDLRDKLSQQVKESVRLGAKPLLGCEALDGDGYFYPASVLGEVGAGMPAYEEETFGPVAAMIRVPDIETAISVANDTDYGLGSSIWSQDKERAEMLSRQIKAGSTFVNGLVKSDPRLPFGGVKCSGFGRELADLGLREFVNQKTVWIS
jgi:succinate-semialdehyde dehydrogenase/glutarate-semialdehyde dehydrogenase